MSSVDSKKTPVTQNSAKMTKPQKEAVAILSIGTFLEYFDLMLYVHMAVLLNDLFFPKTDDPFTNSLYAATAFCSTYLLRPVGALIIGYIGDNIGRKHTVLITTFTMSISCVIMTMVPTYAQIGIAATWIVTLCRVLQGFSSMGEIIGAEVYITEILKRPINFVASSIIGISYSVGTLAALGIATFVISFGLNWRIAFAVGAFIAVVGFVARTTLRETADFVDYKKRIKEKSDFPQLKHNIKEKFNKKTFFSYFSIELCHPIFFYMIYIYTSTLLKRLDYPLDHIISQNLKVTLMFVATQFAYVYLVKIFHPLLIVRVRSILLCISFPFALYILHNASNDSDVFIFQALLVFLSPLTTGSLRTVVFKSFAVSKRFMSSSLGFAFSHVLGYVVASFGINTWSTFLASLLAYQSSQCQRSYLS